MRPDKDGMVTSDTHGAADRGVNSKMPWVILAALILLILIIGFLFRDKLFSGSNKVAGTTEKASGYQAVFLTNGQVYFGKIANTSSDYVNLKDIYYLQVTQPTLQGSQTTPQQQQQQLSLVKLGNELHGPVDSMEINHTQILFYEDMKSDGKVMQAIREYQKNPPAANSQNQSGQVPTQQVPAAQPQTTTPIPAK